MEHVDIVLSVLKMYGVPCEQERTICHIVETIRVFTEYLRIKQKKTNYYEQMPDQNCEEYAVWNGCEKHFAATWIQSSDPQPMPIAL